MDTNGHEFVSYHGCGVWRRRAFGRTWRVVPPKTVRAKAAWRCASRRSPKNAGAPAGYDFSDGREAVSTERGCLTRSTLPDLAHGIDFIASLAGHPLRLAAVCKDWPAARTAEISLEWTNGINADTNDTMELKNKPMAKISVSVLGLFLTICLRGQALEFYTTTDASSVPGNFHGGIYLSNFTVINGQNYGALAIGLSASNSYTLPGQAASVSLPFLIAADDGEFLDFICNFPSFYDSRIDTSTYGGNIGYFSLYPYPDGSNEQDYNPLSYYLGFGQPTEFGSGYSTGDLEYTLDPDIPLFGGTFNFSRGFSGYYDGTNANVNLAGTWSFTYTVPVTNQLVLAGANVPFSVFLLPAATQFFSLQWQYNGTNICNATNAVYSISSVATNNAGNYSLMLTNPAPDDNFSSPSAALSVIVSPASRTNCASSTATFTTTAFSPESLNFQWQKNGTNLVNGGNVSGATNCTLTIANVSATDAAAYSAVVSDPYTSVTTSNALLTVPAPVPPALTVQFSAGYPVLNLSGMLSSNFVVQYSTNLTGANWTTLLSVTNLTTSPYSFVDPAGMVPPARFYRALMH
jgi:hypothetical protein